ncbi:hypothetical protein V6N13_114261 [Hibiscus sabdariffa]|uniref:Uncharacterized protein n=1 Tax=Hibiscus sabdariffa TaxID=183260 RepID=A0ABR2U1Z2_9ROSI
MAFSSFSLSLSRQNPPNTLGSSIVQFDYGAVVVEWLPVHASWVFPQDSSTVPLTTLTAAVLWSSEEKEGEDGGLRTFIEGKTKAIDDGSWSLYRCDLFSSTDSVVRNQQLQVHDGSTTLIELGVLQSRVWHMENHVVVGQETPPATTLVSCLALVVATQVEATAPNEKKMRSRDKSLEARVRVVICSRKGKVKAQKLGEDAWLAMVCPYKDIVEFLKMDVLVVSTSSLPAGVSIDGATLKVNAYLLLGVRLSCMGCFVTSLLTIFLVAGYTGNAFELVDVVATNEKNILFPKFNALIGYFTLGSVHCYGFGIVEAPHIYAFYIPLLVELLFYLAMETVVLASRVDFYSSNDLGYVYVQLVKIAGGLGVGHPHKE